MEKTALFAGTFDPYTVGHHSIVVRALGMFDKIIVAVGRNVGKSHLHDTEERVEKIKNLYANEPRVEVASYEGLTTDFAKEQGACCLLDRKSVV